MYKSQQLKETDNQWSIQRKGAAFEKKANKTGLPDALKSGVENLSGHSMDDVKVHYNSSKPAQLNALAYAQGSDIHLGRGQEKHLPHEAWHVTQQKQGRVKATTKVAGVNVNDNAALEKEADVMGAKAANNDSDLSSTQLKSVQNSSNAIQCFGQIRFANLKDKAKYQSKGDEIIASLRATPSIADFLEDKNTLITLEWDPQLASVSVIGDQVQITLSPWFFEQESRGRILGMLAHEFGVHPLASEAMSEDERAAERLAIENDTAFATGLPDNDQITPGAAGQTDHVFAALEGQPRFTAYRLTAYQMASAMYERAHGDHPTVTDAHVTDLIMTYLSDIAMILATNDDRKKIVQRSEKTAAAFNYVRGRWLHFVGAQDNGAELTALTPGVKTGKNVLKEVASLVGSFVISPFTGSTDNDQTKQEKVGFFNPVYSDLTTTQQGVLDDYELNLGDNGDIGYPTFLQAIGLERHLGTDILRATAINKITPRFANLDALDPRSESQERDYQLLARIRPKLQDDELPAVINYSDLNVLAWALNSKIRVIKPNGKIMMADYGAGQMITLLQVTKPQNHYRYAQA